MPVVTLAPTEYRAYRGGGVFSSGTMESGNGGNGRAASYWEYLFPSDLGDNTINSATMQIRVRAVDGDIYPLQTQIGIIDSELDFDTLFSVGDPTTVAMIASAPSLKTSAFGGAADHLIGTSYGVLTLDVKDNIIAARTASRLPSSTVFVHQMQNNPTDFIVAEVDGGGQLSPPDITIDYESAGSPIAQFNTTMRYAR